MLIGDSLHHMKLVSYVLDFLEHRKLRIQIKQFFSLLPMRCLRYSEKTFELLVLLIKLFQSIPSSPAEDSVVCVIAGLTREVIELLK